MTGSTALDIVIGLIFIYLLYSLFATLVQEIIATNLSFRAKVLEIAIIRMLNDDNTVKGFVGNLFGRFGAILSLLFLRSNSRLIPNSLADHFYRNPLIKYLAQDSWHSKPSYLDKTNFSKVLIDILRGDTPNPGDDFRSAIQNSLKDGLLINQATINNAVVTSPVLPANSDTLKFLRSIWVDSQGDIEKFKAALETWYDNTMERATGWYKQYTQVVLLAIGLLIAIIFNVDTLAIINKLSINPKLTTQIVQQADAFIKAHPGFKKDIDELKSKGDTITANKLIANRNKLFDEASRMMNNDLASISNLLGLGWKKKKDHKTFMLFWIIPMKGFLCYHCNHIGLKNHVGWLLTALAISLGAPFWFDMLNKLMKLRGSVATETATDEKGKSSDRAKKITPKA